MNEKDNKIAYDLKGEKTHYLGYRLLLSAGEVGILIGLSRSAVYGMISAGLLPPSFKLGKRRKWRRTDIEKWVELGMPNIEKFEQSDQEKHC